MNYTIFYKNKFPVIDLSFVNSDTQDVILNRTCDCDDESDISDHINTLLTDIQAGLPKGHTISINVVEIEDFIH